MDDQVTQKILLVIEESLKNAGQVLQHLNAVQKTAKKTQKEFADLRKAFSAFDKSAKQISSAMQDSEEGISSHGEAADEAAISTNTFSSAIK